MKTSRVLRVALVSALLVVAASSPATAQSGALDTSFSQDGKALLHFGAGVDASAALDVWITSSGKVVTAGPVTMGTESVFGVSRLRANGTPDPTFHGDGRRLTSLTGQDVPRRVVPLGGGAFLVAGSAGNAFGLVAYRPDGRLDQGFGTGGKVVTDVSAAADQIRDVRVQPDGAILVAGTAGDGFAVVRYLRDGTLDPGFGDGGVVLTTDGFPGHAETVRLQPDGRLLVVGRSEATDQGYYGFAVARYDLDGALDPTFGGGDGLVTTFPPDREYTTAYAVLVQPDGRIVVGGSAFGEGEYSYFCLARYLSDGTPDPAFGVDGVSVKTIRLFYNGIFALARQRDGRIVAAGWTLLSFTSYEFAVARYRADGGLDRSFSDDGRAVIGFGPRHTAKQGAVAVRHGRIVAVGQEGRSSGQGSAFVVRFRQ